MAKPLGQKSLVIRQAITAHPDKGNTAIAEMLNDADERMDDKIKVTAQDVAAQKQAMKKAGATATPAPAPAEPATKPARKKPGRKPGRPAAPAAPAAAAPRPAGTNPVDLIDQTLELASRAGGVGELKKLVDRLADMRRW